MLLLYWRWIKILSGVTGKRYDELCTGTRGPAEACPYDRNYATSCEDQWLVPKVSSESKIYLTDALKF